MRWLLASLAAVATLSGVPEMARADQAGQSAEVGQADEEGGRAFLDQYDKMMSARRFADALAMVDPLAKDQADPDVKATIEALRVTPLLGLNREREALEAIDAVHRLNRNDPFPTTIVFYGTLSAKRYDLAGNMIDDLLAKYPDAARNLDISSVFLALRKAPEEIKQRTDDRRIGLARIGFGGADGDYLGGQAVEILVKRGDLAGATDILRYIDEVQVLENMLIQKKFSPLWPRIEAMAGPHMKNVRAELAGTAQRAYEADPSNHRKLAEYANALRHAGQQDQAIALRTKLPATIQAMAGADEQMGWAVNNVAIALHEAGRGDEADALFRLLNDAPMPKEYWRISMKINRLEYLVTDGKYAAALPLIEPTARLEGSPYAAQLIRRLRYCVLSAVGRKVEAEAGLSELLEHADDAPGPTVDGLLCAGDIDRAEKVALEALKKESFEEDFVRQLQPRKLTSDDPSVWQGRWEELKARPAIRAAYDQLGRDMPSDFVIPNPAIATRH